MLEERDLLTLSKLLELLIKDYKLARVLRLQEFNIPDQFIPALNDKDKSYMEKEKAAIIKNRLKTTKIKYPDDYDDTRLERFQYVIRDRLYYKLDSLKLLGLLDYSYQVKNLGEKFMGPYNFSVDISFTPKALSYKSLNEKFNLLPDCKSITKEDILFKDFTL